MGYYSVDVTRANSSFQEWIKIADRYMMNSYCINLYDEFNSHAKSSFQNGETPQDACEWIATKYDLDSLM